MPRLLPRAREAREEEALKRPSLEAFQDRRSKARVAVLSFPTPEANCRDGRSSTQEECSGHRAQVGASPTWYEGKKEWANGGGFDARIGGSSHISQELVLIMVGIRPHKPRTVPTSAESGLVCPVIAHGKIVSLSLGKCDEISFDGKVFPDRAGEARSFAVEECRGGTSRSQHQPAI